MPRWAVFLWGMLIGWFVAFLFVQYVQPHYSHTPNCPTEDSCKADYHDGKWYIYEVTN